LTIITITKQKINSNIDQRRLKMKANRLVVILIMVLLVGVISAEAAIPSATAADWDWTVKEFDADEKGVLNLSTAFGGLNELPMLSYSRVGSNRIYQAYLAPSDNLKTCGPNNAWFCTDWEDLELSPQTVSNVATYRYGPDTFGVFWAYQAGNYIRGAKVEYTNDLTLLTSNWENLLDVRKFGGVVVGAPSIVNTGGRFKLAVTIRDNSDFFTHKLVYLWHLGTNNTSCISSGSTYQCDVIEQAFGMGSIGAPSLQVSPDGQAGIAYYYIKNLKYAYPFPEPIPIQVRYPNCGPGNNTWRCITINEPLPPNSTVGTQVNEAFGLTTADRVIAFTYHDNYSDGLKVAEYVGSGGNCGVDGKNLTNSIRRWQCSDVDNIVYNKNGSFSVAIDPEGFPVIAYENTLDDLSPTSLYLSYPKARVGDSSGGWLRQTIDPAPHIDVNVGGQAALALNTDGLGFIAYRVDDGYNYTEPLKIALQEQEQEIVFNLYLPMILR
jgi:hypothetical protein